MPNTTTKTKTVFKSTITEKRWVELQKKKIELQSKSATSDIQEKIDTINSFMTACKIGFNLTEAKVKKITKFLKQKTGKNTIKYGTLPDGVKPVSTLFKDIVVLYAEQDEIVVFREHNS